MQLSQMKKGAVGRVTGISAADPLIEAKLREATSLEAKPFAW